MAPDPGAIADVGREAVYAAEIAAFEGTSYESIRHLDRLVELELREMGFEDPELTRRRQEELSRRYRSEIASCVGRSLTDEAMRCIEAAETAEALSHDCLH